jgi:RHS repeat-associated protein
VSRRFSISKDKSVPYFCAASIRLPGRGCRSRSPRGRVPLRSTDRLTQALHALSTPAQTTTNYVYNSPTDLTTYQDQTSSGDRAIQSEQIWDDFGRPTVSKTYTGGGSYIETDTAYDALGRIATVSNPYQPGDTPVNTTYAYDALGRTTSVTTPDSAVTNYSYAGNVTTISDPAGNSKKLVSDALGRLTDVYEDSSGSNFHTQYSTSNNVMTVNQGGQTRAFTYDTLGRLISAQNPESGTVIYNYDNAGNTISRTDARGIVTCYGSYSYPTCTKSYDQLNRPRQISYSDNTPTVTFTYDGVANGTGQLTAINNGNSAMVFTAFDGMGRVSASTQQTNGVAYNFSYSYNLAGALKSEAYPSGRIVTTAADAANRPYSLSGSLTGNGGLTNITTNYVTQTSYLANGGIGSLTRGNNLWHFESYNNRSQLTGVAEQMNNQSGAQLFNFSANWVNPSGHNNGTLQGLTIASTDNPTFTQSFGYDGLNRLTSASESGSWSQAYNYDQYGNMWMPTSSGLPAPSLGPTAPTANAYSASGPGNNRNVNSTYDNAGNLTVFGAMSVSYDAENRQTAVGSNTYSYDGFGLRVGKTTANGSTVYVYDAFGQLAAEYGSATTTSLCKTCYLSVDHLGSLRLVTDQNGSAIARHDYAPFGQEIPAGIGQRSLAWGASDYVSQKFTGQERDSETNLDFFQARYLSSGLGRFMSPDPYNAGADLTNPQSWNAYAYVLGNPLNGTDPSGTDRIDCGGGVQADACVTASPDPVDTTLFDDWWWNGVAYNCSSCIFRGGTTVANPPAETAPPSSAGNVIDTTDGSQFLSLSAYYSYFFLNRSTAAPKNGCSVSASSLDNYLGTKSSPMIGQGANLMTAGAQYNVDPRLLVSLAGAETRFGTNITAGQFNAFNVLYHGLNSPFASFQSAINSVGHSLTNPRNGYDFTNTATLYGHYCSGAGCSSGLKNVNTFMNQQGANTSALHNPCK